MKWLKRIAFFLFCLLWCPVAAPFLLLAAIAAVFMEVVDGGEHLEQFVSWAIAPIEIVGDWAGV